MRILIVGCGYVGVRLAARLLANGHEVIALRRTPQAPMQGMTWLTGDVHRFDDLPIPHPIQVLVLAAGLRRNPEVDYQHLFVQGYQRVITHLQRTHSLQRIVMVSTTGVFAETNGHVVDESSPTNEALIPGRYYLKAEELIMNSGVCPVVARLSGIYGPDRVRLIRKVRDGRAVRYPPPVHYLNHIHADDAAGALAHLVDLQQPAPLYVVSDHEPADRNEVLCWLAKELEQHVPPTLASTQPQRHSGHKQCCNRQLRESGYTFTYPTYREGYAALIKESST